MAAPSNIEDLVGLASRISDYPDPMLAELTQQDGIESVLAATEIKDRADMRAEAQAQPIQDPTVIDALIQKLMGATQSPMGITGNPMDIPQDPMMMQANVPQTGMRKPPLPRMPERMQPELSPELLAQQPPMARVGGLIRKFDIGGQFNYNPYFQEALAQTFQMTPQELIAAGADPSQLQRASGEYAQRLEETPESIASVYNPVAQGTDTLAFLSGRLDPWNPEIAELETVGPQQRLDMHIQQLAREGFEKDPYLGSAQVADLPMEGVKISSPEDLQRRFFPSGVTPGQFIPSPVAEPLPELIDLASTQQADVNAQGDNVATTGSGTPAPPAGAGGAPAAGILGPDYGSNIRRGDPNSLAAAAATGLNEQFQAISRQVSNIQSPLALDATSTELQEEISNFESEESNRIKELGEEVDQYMGDLDELEGEIPDRESIKKRIGIQTKLGLAQAFFNAAEKGSPDFITSMAGAFGGASEVMNKMTGQEQKEIYQHAVDEYNRKSSRANAAFTRRQGLLQERNQRATTRATTKTNYLAAIREANDVAQDQITNSIELYKAGMAAAENADQENREWTQLVSNIGNTYDDNMSALTIHPQTGAVIGSRKQHTRAHGLFYADFGVSTAQNDINLGLGENLREIQTLYNNAVTQGSGDPMGDAWGQYLSTVNQAGEARYGDLKLMTQFMPDMEAVMQQSVGTGGQLNRGLLINNINNTLKPRYPWLDIGDSL